MSAEEKVAAHPRLNNSEGMNDMNVTKESLIGDILDTDIGTAQFFLEMGMHCLGCPSSRNESLAEACAVHGTDADSLVDSLNAYFGNN